jgi:hypothetical protein
MQDPTEKHVSDVGILDKYYYYYYYYYFMLLEAYILAYIDPMAIYECLAPRLRGFNFKNIFNFSNVAYSSQTICNAECCVCTS